MDFVEGMVYSEIEGVMMIGWYVFKEEVKWKGNKINEVCFFLFVVSFVSLWVLSWYDWFFILE